VALLSTRIVYSGVNSVEFFAMAFVVPSQKVLPNGLRLVKISLPSLHSLTSFLVVRSGSRFESQDNAGIAHFLEHLVFKGTAKYPTTREIAESIEGVGGHFNAWTANDHTVYWNTVPAKWWERSLEVALELAFFPRLRQSDIEKERSVILEEMRMIRDDPARFVDDLCGEITFPNHPLGRMVIGNEQAVRTMKWDDFQAYHQTHYAPSQTLLVVAGRLPPSERIEQHLARQTAALRPRPVSSATPFTGPSRQNIKLMTKPTDQTHFMLGSADKSLGLKAQSRFIGVLLNTVLGSGMSARLFLQIRERLGLAYAIYSQTACFEETGGIFIYGGVNTEKTIEALQALKTELLRLQDEPIGEKELAKAKELITGAYELRSDDPLELCRWYGVNRLLGADETIEEAQGIIRAITASQLQQLSRRLFAKDRLTLAVIGPHNSASPLRQVLDR